MLGKKEIRPIRTLALLTGIAVLLFASAAHANEPKLESESYLIPPAILALPFTSATSIRPA